MTNVQEDPTFSSAGGMGFFLPMMGAGDSMMVFGGGTSGGMAFDIDGDKIVNCGLAFGRQWLTCGDTTVAELRSKSPSGYIYATVSHGGTGTPTLAVHHGRELPENGLEASHRALYKAVGKDWVDLRSAITIVAMD